MAGKYDKRSGVFALKNTNLNTVYLGKSNGVGVAIRDCKSKLNRGLFWNKALQDDWLKYGGIDGGVFEMSKPILLEDGADVDLLLSVVQDEYLKKGYDVYNHIEIMQFDEDPLEDLEPLQRNICERIISAFLDGYLTSEEINEYLLSKNI